MTVALVTAASARHLDEDLPLLTAALGALGVESVVADWDDPAVEWGDFDLVVVRSTWDYPDRRNDYLAWAVRVAKATTLVNSPEVLRWNTDKRYLHDLAAADVPVVPTTFLERGKHVDLSAIGECVVKPAVSAGARDTGRYGEHERAEAAAHVSNLLAAGRVVMVQPYLPGIDAHGETALVYVDGRLSHAARKSAILAGPAEMIEGLYATEELSARTPTEAEKAAGSHVLQAAAAVLGLDEPLLYARVDLVPGPDGEPLLLELEVTEPSLFLTFDPGSPDRVARAIARRTRPQ